jgi:Predicted transcriptional regulators
LATLGQRLKLLVKEKGMEQQEVAELLGLKTSTFNGYAGDKREPSIKYLKEFAEYFDVSIDYLTGYSDIRNPYLPHLSSDLKHFVMEPKNVMYLELASDIKKKTNAKASNHSMIS